MKPVAELIWARVADKPDGGCWNWPGAKTPGGYGKIGRDKRTLYVHRVAYEAAHGPIPTGFVVMHRCDNPGCCNPDHLTVGTKAANSADMVRKHRNRAGVKHWNATLSRDQVEDIRRRAAAGAVQRRLAHEYGVTFQHVSSIVGGKSWAINQGG